MQVCFNGIYLSSDELKFSDFNRLRYADSFFESILVYNGFIPLWEYHLIRIQHSLNVLKMQLPEINLLEAIEETILQNTFLGVSLRVRITIWRNLGMLYTPESGDASFLIETEPLKNHPFQTIEKLGIFEDYHSNISALSNLKSGNALLYVLAKQYAKAHFYDEVLIVNYKNEISEAASSNFFAVKNSKIFTTPLSSGCVAGVMRQFILDNFEVIDKQIVKDDLKNFDELFLTNAVSLIMPVAKYQGKIYNTNISNELITFVTNNLLNEV